MSKKFGVDISYHNGTINFEKLSKAVDFVIIRAGYGQGNIDKNFYENVTGCINYNIPFGFYWFSYANTNNAAKSEAEYFCDIVKKYSPEYPLFFDYEDESLQGKDLVFSLISQMASVFINTCAYYGRVCGIYCDNEFYEGYAKNFASAVPIWYARWCSTEQTKGDIWQYTDSGTVNGINGRVDCNYCYVEFNKNTTEEKATNNYLNQTKVKELLKTGNDYTLKYVEIANDIINGKYGNGKTRKDNLIANGYDPNFAQSIVNILIE